MNTFRPSGYDIERLDFSYGGVSCLKDITLSLEPGRFYGLIGPNGSGKSTLLDLLSGHLRPTAGTIRFKGTDLASYPQKELALLVTSVPQSFSLNFDFSVYDVVMMGRHPHIGRFSTPLEKDHRHVRRALRLMGVDRFADRSIRKLSGGEKQRVMVARALAQDTEFLLLDEVTANLDINHTISIMRTVSELIDRGRTVLAAMHDLNMALAFCDRVFVLQHGRLARHGAAAEVITGAMVADIYQVPARVIRAGDGNDHLHYRYR